MSELIEAVPERFLAPTELDRFTYLLDRNMKPEGYRPALVAVAAINNLVWLTRAAALGSRAALSWRDYKVGAAALAYNFDTPVMGITTGANVKPFENGTMNFHAEQIALAKARKNNLDHIVGLAVWGDPTDLNANAQQTPTLRPCRRCVTMFEELPECKPETLIISGNEDLSVCEFYTADELRRYYENPNANGPVSEVPPYSLADDMDDDKYASEIFRSYLLPKVRALYQN